MTKEAVSPEDIYILRPHRSSDLNFIQNSWGSSYYKGAEYNSSLSPKEFNLEHRPIREKILNNPNTSVIIACGKVDEDLILGWIIIEKPKTKGTILHYIYIKEVFKGEGISESLLAQALKAKPILVTHMTDRARKIIKKKKYFFKDYVFSPETIMIRDKYQSTLPQGEAC